MPPLTITRTEIPGLLVLRLEVQHDEDGWFKENWHRHKMVSLGLPDFRPIQQNVTHVVARGVTRGFLAEPWDRLISLLQGKAMVACVDLRTGTGFGRTWTYDLDRSTAIFVPRGVALAHQVQVDGTTFNYLLEHHWTPEARPRYSSVDPFDPALKITWPIPRDQAIVARRDMLHPPLAAAIPMPPRRTLVVGTETRLARALLAELPNASGITTGELQGGAESVVDLSAYDTIINAFGDTSSGLRRSPSPRDTWTTAAERAQLVTGIARRHRLRYVHISADCVFMRDAPVHLEGEPLDLRDAHGQALAAGELIASTVPRHLVVRTSRVVGTRTGFINDVATAARRAEVLEVVEQQPGHLTFASQLADAISHILDAGAPAGTYNVTGDGRPTAWADLAREVYRLRGSNPDLVVAVPVGAEGGATRPPATLDLARIKSLGWAPGSSWLILADRVPRPLGVEPSTSPIAPRRSSYRVLFVCTGNIARSAYAAIVARHGSPPELEFTSAGTGAVVGEGIDPPMAVHLGGRGDASTHVARQVTKELLEQSDLVITMAAEHRRYILDAWPSLGRKAFVIGQVARELRRLPESVTLAGLVDHLWRNRTTQPDDDVADPHRRGAAAAAEASRLIDERLDVIIDTLSRLVGVSLGG